MIQQRKCQTCHRIKNYSEYRTEKHKSCTKCLDKMIEYRYKKKREKKSPKFKLSDYIKHPDCPLRIENQWQKISFNVTELKRNTNKTSNAGREITIEHRKSLAELTKRFDYKISNYDVEDLQRQLIY